MEGASKTINAFKTLFVSQLLSRLFTFFLNVISTRSLSPTIYGVAAVQFHLINTTILTISREGFRRGCLRIPCKSRQEVFKLLLLATLAVPLGVLLSTSIILFFIKKQKVGNEVYVQSLWLQGAAAILELCSEPLYILASTRFLFGLRAIIETVAVVGKGLFLIFLLEKRGSPALVAFSLSQFAYAGLVCIGYVTYYISRILCRYQKQQKGTSRSNRDSKQLQHKTDKLCIPDSQILQVCGAFTLQAIEKLLLAEGSKMVMAFVQDSHCQGVYGLVSNLGSLVVRTLFQPFEEAAFAVFSTLSGQRTSSQLSQQWQLLSLLVRAMSIVGLLAAAFGPAYSYIVLLAMYSQQWAESQAPLALGLYSQYIPLLAVNGVLESFVHAVADQNQLGHINFWLVIVTGLHLLVSLLLVNSFGANGLILADIANMMARILYCILFVVHRFKFNVKDFHLRHMLPSRIIYHVLGAVFLVTCASRLLLLPESSSLLTWIGHNAGRASLDVQHWSSLNYLYTTVARLEWQIRAVLHVMVGVVCLCIAAGLICYFEKKVLKQLLRIRSRDVKFGKHE